MAEGWVGPDFLWIGPGCFETATEEGLLLFFWYRRYTKIIPLVCFFDEWRGYGGRGKTSSVAHFANEATPMMA